MNRDELQRQLGRVARELADESHRWRDESRPRLQRDARNLAIAWAAVPTATARELRAAEALLDAGLTVLARHAVARLELEMERTHD